MKSALAYINKTRCQRLRKIIKDFVESREAHYRQTFRTMPQAEAISKINRYCAYYRNLKLVSNMKMVLLLGKEWQLLMPNSYESDKNWAIANKMKKAVEQCQKEIQPPIPQRGNESVEVADYSLLMKV